jgi:hypothetical protein
MMKFYRYLILLLLLQTCFHVFMGLIYYDSNDVSPSCILSTCFENSHHPFIHLMSQFYWLFVGLLFLGLMAVNSFWAIFGCSLIGLVSVLFFGNLDDASFDLIIIFFLIVCVCPVAYISFKDKVSQDGLRLAPIVCLSVFVCAFPLAWVVRATWFEISVSDTWEIVVVIASIMSFPAAIFLIVALLTKPLNPNTDRGTNMEPKESLKEKSNYTSLIVIFIYCISLFFDTEYISRINPLIGLLHVAIFWIVIYPIFRNKKEEIKRLLMVVYLLIFQFAIDSVMYHLIYMFFDAKEFIIIITDYVVILVYLAIFPIFKTLPKTIFLLQNRRIGYLNVLKKDFYGELILLLMLIIKMNLSFYANNF